MSCSSGCLDWMMILGRAKHTDILLVPYPRSRHSEDPTEGIV
jgi:hypothetical protein